MHWKLLKDVFVHYACLYSSDMFFMGSGAYNEILGQCNILDKSVGESVADANLASSLVSIAKVDEEVATDLLGDIEKNEYNISDQMGEKLGSLAISKPVPPANPMPSKVMAPNSSRKPSVAPGVLATVSSSSSASSSSSSQRPSSNSEKFSSLQSSAKSTRKNSSFSTVLNPESERRVNTVVGLKKGCDRTEAEMIFIAAAISGSKHDNNSKRSLSRDQFIDSLVSIASVKFVRTKICFDLAEATEKLIQEHIIPNAGCF